MFKYVEGDQLAQDFGDLEQNIGKIEEDSIRRDFSEFLRIGGKGKLIRLTTDSGTIKLVTTEDEVDYVLVEKMPPFSETSDTWFTPFHDYFAVKNLLEMREAGIPVLFRGISLNELASAFISTGALGECLRQSGYDGKTALSFTPYADAYTIEHECQHIRDIQAEVLPKLEGKLISIFESMSSPEMWSFNMNNFSHILIYVIEQRAYLREVEVLNDHKDERAGKLVPVNPFTYQLEEDTQLMHVSFENYFRNLMERTEGKMCGYSGRFLQAIGKVRVYEPDIYRQMMVEIASYLLETDVETLKFENRFRLVFGQDEPSYFVTMTDGKSKKFELSELVSLLKADEIDSSLIGFTSGMNNDAPLKEIPELQVYLENRE